MKTYGVYDHSLRNQYRDPTELYCGPDPRKARAVYNERATHAGVVLTTFDGTTSTTIASYRNGYRLYDYSGVTL